VRGLMLNCPAISIITATLDQQIEHLLVPRCNFNCVDIQHGGLL
jgi:hypothetical protein